MKSSESATAFDDCESAATGQRGGVWLLADVLPELLAKYQVVEADTVDDELVPELVGFTV